MKSQTLHFSTNEHRLQINLGEASLDISVDELYPSHQLEHNLWHMLRTLLVFKKSVLSLAPPPAPKLSLSLRNDWSVDIDVHDLTGQSLGVPQILDWVSLISSFHGLFESSSTVFTHVYAAYGHPLKTRKTMFNSDPIVPGQGRAVAQTPTSHLNWQKADAIIHRRIWSYDVAHARDLLLQNGRLYLNTLEDTHELLWSDATLIQKERGRYIQYAQGGTGSGVAVCSRLHFYGQDDSLPIPENALTYLRAPNDVTNGVVLQLGHTEVGLFDCELGQWRWVVSQPSQAAAQWFHEDNHLLVVGDSGLFHVLDTDTGRVAEASPMQGLPSGTGLHHETTIVVPIRQPGAGSSQLFCPYIHGQRVDYHWTLGGVIHGVLESGIPGIVWVLSEINEVHILQKINVENGSSLQFVRLPELSGVVKLESLGDSVVAYDQAGVYALVPPEDTPFITRLPGPVRGASPFRLSRDLFFSLSRGLNVHRLTDGKILGSFEIDVDDLNAWLVSPGGDVCLAYSDRVEAFVLGGFLRRIK